MIIIDDFVNDKLLLEAIKKDDSFFNNNGKYMWWNGWWNSPADTIKKQLIEYLWCENSPYKSVVIEGFEYWTGQYGEGVDKNKLDYHLDKDEHLWETKKEISVPEIGTIFYPIPMKIDGGYLEIESKENDLVERIQAKYNRLIVFPAGIYPHRITPVRNGLRSAIAINLWKTVPSGNLFFE
jgi:hypothetical protein